MPTGFLPLSEGDIFQYVRVGMNIPIWVVPQKFSFCPWEQWQRLFYLENIQFHFSGDY